jgi:hypothetical protein
MQPDDADAIVMLVKNAMGPVFERLAAAEARLASLDGVRDRVVAIETKQAMSVQQPSSESATVAEVRELVSRFAAPSAPSADVEQLTIRVKALEDRPEQPPDPIVHVLNTNLTDLQVSTKSLQSELTKEVGGLRERLAVLETRAPVPGPPGPAGKDGLDGKNGIDGVNGKDGRDGSDAAVGDLVKDFSALRERLGVVELKSVVPGPPGPAGKDGKDGRDGRDGHDGVELKDLSMTQEHDRAFTLSARMGGEAKVFGTFSVPVHIYRGVWVDGKSYERGDGVTWAGSHWHCNNETTDKPGEGSKDWTLTVKRGRDGKDGKDAEQPLPVVSAGRRS